MTTFLKRRQLLHASVVVLFLMLFALTIPGFVHGQTSPTYHTLTELAGPSGEARAINNHGQIVGSIRIATGARRAALWQNGTMTDLGTLGGLHGQSQALDINDHGQIVGWSDSATGTHAFLWQNGTMTDLGTLGELPSQALAINNQGQIVGSFGHPWALAPQRAVVWQNGTITDLHAWETGSSVAGGINDRGQIVGAHITGSDQAQAVIWQNGTVRPLSSPSGSPSHASAINEQGQIVGSMRTTSATHDYQAFLWQNGTMTPLGDRGGTPRLANANAINEQGQVVGWAQGTNVERRAVLWHNGIITTLPAPPDQVTHAFDINDHCHIIGARIDPVSGAQTAVVWSPGKPPVFLPLVLR